MDDATNKRVKQSVKLFILLPVLNLTGGFSSLFIFFEMFKEQNVIYRQKATLGDFTHSHHHNLSYFKVHSLSNELELRYLKY